MFGCAKTSEKSPITNISNPDSSDETSLTTSYEKAGSSISIGSINYYRFWLDVPGAQASGDYNNTVYFKGTQAGSSC